MSQQGTGRVPAIILLGSLIAVGFFLIPIVALLTRMDWGSLPSIVSDERTREAFVLSLVVPLGAVLIALPLSYPLAWTLARARFPGRALARSVVLLPMVLPPVVGGVALLAAFGSRGLLGPPLDSLGIRLPFSTAGAIVAATFVSAPFLVVSLESGFRSLDRRLEEAAETLGASHWLTFRVVMLPALLPALRSGIALCWARALGEFGATIAFAGNMPGRTQTLPLAIYQSLHAPEGLQGAIGMSLLLVSVSLIVLVLLRGRVLPS